MNSKNKKGFTLVELIGVLVIIGLLNILFTQVFGQVYKDSKEKIYLKQIENIKMAAKAFTSDYKYLYPDDDEVINITLGQLKDTGYINKSVVNPKTKREFSDCMIIQISSISSDYNYDVKVDDVPAHCDRSSKITVSNPSKKFINENAKSTYIMTININDTTDSKLFSSYGINQSKISLTGNTKSDKDIIGENNIYKLTVYGGSENGEVTFKFDSGSLLDDKGNDLTELIPEFEAIIVDNIEPEIIFEPNGNDTYTRNQEFTITVNKNDDYSDLDADTFKYVFSSNKNAEASLLFNNAETITNSSDSGTYYLTATACDQAGNCIKEGPSRFMLDNEKPLINNVMVSSSNANYNSKNINISAVGSDQYSGLSKVCMKESSSTNNLGSDDCTWLDIRNDNKYSLSLSGSEGSGNSYYIHIFMKDAAGNISEEKVSNKYTMYKYCDEKGTPTYGNWGSCSASCGGGTQTRTVTTYDKYFTSHSCITPDDSQSCNTQDCCSSTYPVQGAWGSCSATCGGGTQSATINYYSNYSNQWCSSNVTSQPCNTQSCFNCNSSSTEFFGTAYGNIAGNYGNWVSASKSWGQWCHANNKTCYASGGYVRICAGTACGPYTGYTAAQINSICGTNHAKYWCSCP